ncbi:MAG: hypothetical protein HEQ14_14670 [Aphanizomenon flos-aquae CP01]|jgi:hypothetical protein|nr:hypothetical protein [Aphanizomenon flos-aquae CP01]
MSEQESENKDVENPIEATPVVEPIKKDDNKSSKQYGGGKVVEIGGNKKSPLDTVKEQLNKIYPS